MNHTPSQLKGFAVRCRQNDEPPRISGARKLFKELELNGDERLIAAEALYDASHATSNGTGRGSGAPAQTTIHELWILDHDQLAHYSKSTSHSLASQDEQRGKS